MEAAPSTHMMHLLRGGLRVTMAFAVHDEDEANGDPNMLGPHALSEAGDQVGSATERATLGSASEKYSGNLSWDCTVRRLNSALGRICVQMPCACHTGTNIISLVTELQHTRPQRPMLQGPARDVDAFDDSFLLHDFQERTVLKHNPSALS
ncbi:uncharacterized protein B0I36DRAFT_406415 [Microdochium trichocladiopsis]|uniref:Uncharacterized protein n=1 Tax=Microdochium trichocladiopsis TaxID=1682393 RepID=A0A9P8YD94_9PEZI|nr:uncharacterized protein B0I36DRAFT_406415 [Microdochium trichocladiopsis]KAH7035795.1 hypothetical protein B0I36DRAFT_406415 [Microdochium trichocladiopsis]